MDRHDLGPAECDKRIETAAQAMATSAYSPYRRAVAIKSAVERKAARANLSPAARREFEQKLNAVVDLLPKSAAEDGKTDAWEDRWFAEVNSVIGLHKRLSGNYKAAFERVDAKLAKVPGIEALRLAVNGNFLFYWGWEARTTAFAPGVTEDQFRIFEKRVGEARAALQAAWTRNHNQPRVAGLLLDIEKAIGQGDRGAMETWFERAMMTDGDDQRACWSKLDWLDPKWSGGESPDELLAFGHACAATKNWHTGITLLAADAHLRVGGRRQGMEGFKYMRSPEVWTEIKSVYDEYLEHHPDDDVQRSKYAMLCYLGGRYPEAHAQFQAVGDRLTPWTTFPFYPLEVMKQAREFTAQVVSGKLPPGAKRVHKNDLDGK